MTGVQTCALPISIPGFDVSSWLGYSVPKKTPEAIVKKLSEDIKTAVNDPEVKAKLITAGAEPVGSTPQEVTQFIANELDVWGKVIRGAGIKVE